MDICYIFFLLCKEDFINLFKCNRYWFMFEVNFYNIVFIKGGLFIFILLYIVLVLIKKINNLNNYLYSIIFLDIIFKFKNVGIYYVIYF